MKKINVNRTAEVILSEAGAELINKMYEEFVTRFPNVKALGDEKHFEKGDAYRDQLWALMNTFGPEMFMGNDCPFLDCEIFIEDEAIEEVK